MEYDTWKTGYYDCDPDNFCSQCNTFEQKKDECADFMSGINEMLYGITTFDKEKFEFYIEELSWRLGTPFPANQKLKIFSVENKQNKLFKFTLDLSKQTQKTINF